MAKLKKRKDGRYAMQRIIGGKKVFFYGKTADECMKKFAEYKDKSEVAPTFKELAERWEDDKWETFAPGTQNCYHSSLERALERFADLPCDELDSSEIQELIEELIDQKYSAKSVKTQKCVISTIYRHAAVKGLYKGINPATATIIPRGLPKSTRKPPKEEDIIKIINSDHPWIYPKVLLYTGLRRGEALALCYEDFDHDKGLITIDKEIIYQSNQPILVPRTKTDAGVRTTIFPDPLKELIPRGKKGPMFESTLRRFKTCWSHYCDDLGISITPHQLRHAYASILFDAGIEAKDAQDLLGHADISVTQNIYTHIQKTRKEKTADKLNAYLNSLK